MGLIGLLSSSAIRAGLASTMLAGAMARAQVSPAWQPFSDVKPETSRVEMLRAMGQDLNPYTRKVIVGALADPSRPVVDAAVQILRGDHTPKRSRLSSPACQEATNTTRRLFSPTIVSRSI